LLGILYQWTDDNKQINVGLQTTFAPHPLFIVTEIDQSQSRFQVKEAILWWLICKWSISLVRCENFNYWFQCSLDKIAHFVIGHLIVVWCILPLVKLWRHWTLQIYKDTKINIKFPTKEKFWDEPLVRSQELSVLLAAPDQAGKARLIAAAAPHSGAFLHARPCSSLGTRVVSWSTCLFAAHLCLWSVSRQYLYTWT